jgi:trehalose 6-phosphate synthase/phosphatase
MTAPPKKRIMVVSNRLPVTVKEENEDLKFIPSVGGLATGLGSYLELLRDHPSESLDYLWVGWAGSTIRADKQEEVRSRALSEFNAYPVFLSEPEIDKFYQGFCNKTIWPLFHYFQVYTHYDEDYWAHYVEVNRSFCRTLLDLIGPEDTLWIHDFHLMLLPGMIRAQLPSSTISFFLHIPFPNYEIFRLLPGKWRREILQGLLGADLIGFHTNDYRQDFLRCVLRILGCDCKMGEMIVDGRVVKAEAFPMGIDYARYHEGSRQAAVQQEKSEIHRRLGRVKIVLSIDRLDYTKGIVHRLEAFQTFLETYPGWRRKVVLILIVVPSRTDVEHYEKMKGQIEGLVGRINGRFGSPDWTPIVYMFRALTFSPLCAMYSASHVALLTPLRDGMNLIAKEYVASRFERTGVLILSEMAGASKELLEAIIINPNNRGEIAEALLDALTMPKEEQVRRMKIMQQRLQRYDVVRWAADFMEELNDTIRTSERYYEKMLGASGRSELLEACRKSKKRLLLLDYDGTLVPFAALPGDAVPGPALIDILRALSRDPRNDVVIISGRKKAFLDSYFSGLRLHLVAEHGAWIKQTGHRWLRTAVRADDWKPKLKPLLEHYVDRIAGSFVEEKTYALVWHHRRAEPEPGKLAAQELKDHLLALTANINLHVLEGNKTVEVRVAGVNKGTAALRFINQDSYDFIFCIGDDTTDEDLFSVLPDTAYCIRVGMGGSCAKHTLPNVQEVVRLLGDLAFSHV